MTVDEVLYHWWMWAYHKGCESYFAIKARGIGSRPTEEK